MTRAALVALLAGCAFAAGCTKQEPPTESQEPTGAPAKKAEQEQKPQSRTDALVETLTAPVDYVDTVVTQRGAVRRKVGSLAIQQCVDAFQALEGRYPTSLDELRKARYEIPPPPAGTKYQYDPKTGKAAIVKK